MSYATDRKCHNSEPGTLGHECGKPAKRLGGKKAKFADMADHRGLYWSGYCDRCKLHGHEARNVIEWLERKAS